MKIIVLGGSGFLGSHFCDYLHNKKIPTTIFDLKKSKYLKKGQKMIIGNILKKEQLIKALKNKDVVVNFAGFSDLDSALNDPLGTAKQNIIGTINILISCKKRRIKKFVHASSIYANTEEGSFYGASKKASEDYIERFCRLYKINFSILRFGSLYGPRAQENNGINMILKSAINKNRIEYYGSKLAERQYIHVQDAAKICYNIAKSKKIQNYINITGRKKIRIKNFLKNLSKLLKIEKKIIYKNTKISGHYIKSPSNFKLRLARNYKLEKEKNFMESIKSLIGNPKK